MGRRTHQAYYTLCSMKVFGRRAGTRMPVCAAEAVVKACALRAVLDNRSAMERSNAFPKRLAVNTSSDAVLASWVPASISAAESAEFAIHHLVRLVA